MIVKKYRLDLGERNIRDSEGNWLTKEEERKSRSYGFCIWANDQEFFTIADLVNEFESFFRIDFPYEFEDKIVRLEYDIPEGTFVITKCHVNHGAYYSSQINVERSLFRYCKSVQEVLEYIDKGMETFRIVFNQFKLEKPLTTLYVTSPYSYERCWNYPGA